MNTSLTPYTCLVVLGSFLFVGGAALGQSYTIPWSTVDAGGGRVVSANGYALEGTIGQFDVGVSISGPIHGEWGFWPGVQRRCRADFDNDGSVTSQDFFTFLTAFFQLQLPADFNADGSINSQDFFDFLDAFFAGC